MALSSSEIDVILKDAHDKLKESEGLDELECDLLEVRSFSRIYQMTGQVDETSRKYILKVSSTSRSCRHEYEMYQFLRERGIRSLVPVIFSDPYNYLVTVQEELTDFLAILTRKTPEHQLVDYLVRMGQACRSLEQEPGEFDADEYLAYVLPRVKKLEYFEEHERARIASRIEAICSDEAGERITSALVSDLDFSNVTFDKDGEVVVLDMGDAAFQNAYLNIAQIYLNLKFGYLSRYFERPGRADRLFAAFLRGYGRSELSPPQFALCQCRMIVNMIAFAHEQQRGASRLREQLQLKYYLYRYRRHLNEILGY